MSKTPIDPSRMQKPAKILVTSIVLIFVFSQISDAIDTFTLAMQGTNYHAHIDSLAEKDGSGTGRPGYCAEDYYHATVIEDHSSVTLVNCVGPRVGDNVVIVANHNKSLVRLGTVAHYKLQAIYTLLLNGALLIGALLVFTSWQNKQKRTH